ncbi:MAG: AraC family transcriptional regulator [Myxococcota bacterium]
MTLTTLRSLIERLAPEEGIFETGIEGVQVYRICRRLERIPVVYTPRLCYIARGAKHAILGGETYTYGSGDFLLSTMALPVKSEVRSASANKPLLGVLVSLERREASEVILDYEAVAGRERIIQNQEAMHGLHVGRADDSFLAALLRLLELADDPVAARLLGSGRLRELIFTVLQSECGTQLRDAFNHVRDIARVLSYMRENIREPLSVDDLAQRCGMSKAVFHRRFKAATTYSPLQFIKALRLSDAALLIRQGVNVSQAAEQVGYSSASQFSREFRRHYGRSPKQWVATSPATAQ